MFQSYRSFSVKASEKREVGGTKSIASCFAGTEKPRLLLSLKNF